MMAAHDNEYGGLPATCTPAERSVRATRNRADADTVRALRDLLAEWVADIQYEEEHPTPLVTVPCGMDWSEFDTSLLHVVAPEICKCYSCGKARGEV